MYRISILLIITTLISCNGDKTNSSLQHEQELIINQLKNENAHLKLALKLCQKHEDDLEKTMESQQ